MYRRRLIDNIETAPTLQTQGRTIYYRQLGRSGKGSSSALFRAVLTKVLTIY